LTQITATTYRILFLTLLCGHPNMPHYRSCLSICLSRVGS